MGELEGMVHGACGLWTPEACRMEGQVELPGERLEVGAGKGKAQAFPGVVRAAP